MATIKNYNLKSYVLESKIITFRESKIFLGFLDLIKPPERGFQSKASKMYLRFLSNIFEVIEAKRG